MPLNMISPFDREALPATGPVPIPLPSPVPDLALVSACEHRPGGSSAFRTAATSKPWKRWWGMAADCCYIVIAAGSYLLSCWMMALGLPLMLLLVLTGGNLDMVFVFIGELFGHFAATPQGLRVPFARDAAYCLIGLATAVAAVRLPRFLDRVTATLDNRATGQ